MRYVHPNEYVGYDPKFHEMMMFDSWSFGGIKKSSCLLEWYYLLG